jgi:putative endonuclease
VSLCYYFHVKHFTSKNQQIGLSGELIAINYLENRGFSIIERNYTKKIGEIDIIAQKTGNLHFIEVKTIVKYGDYYNPFENITQFKLKKLSRTILWYLAEKKVSREILWFIDAIAIEVNRETRSAKLNVLWNIT